MSGIRPRRFLILLTIPGLVPALVILFFLKLEEGQLIAAGQQLGDYDLARLLAGLLSTMAPLFLISPAALLFCKLEKPLLAPAFAFIAPIALFGPSWLAGLWIGGAALAPLIGLLVLGLFSVCFWLWLGVIQRWIGTAGALILYGFFWAASGYVGYLKDYILPYIELKITGLITFLSWLIPPMQNGPASVDAFFQSGQFHWGALGPALAQTAVLAVIWFLTKKGED